MCVCMYVCMCVCVCMCTCMCMYATVDRQSRDLKRDMAQLLRAEHRAW